jgi:glycine/D-amino acid oxidase-like deaminating enzyme
LIETDVLIFGGGIAGLWLLDELVERGLGALLVERSGLGQGQTLSSQGIIHGGLKYAITGSQRASAAAIRDMPSLWRDCLSGRIKPDLRGTRVLSEFCCMWRTTHIRSTLGMIGARAGLRSNAEKIRSEDRPVALDGCPGDVYRIDEQVVDTVSLMSVFRERHVSRLMLVDGADRVEFERAGDGKVRAVRIASGRSDRSISIVPQWVVFCAGEGNESLRASLGLPGSVMQRRPLQMVLVRGELPELFGHCIDGAHTRVTVTTVRDSRGCVVWIVGGQVSEDGATLTSDALLRHARDELGRVLPRVDFAGTEWSTYRIDRAERRTADGKRPAGVSIEVDGNVITAWPTKLALAPQLAMLIVERTGAKPTSRRRADGALDGALDGGLDGWPRPEVGTPPWEGDRVWVTID